VRRIERIVAGAHLSDGRPQLPCHTEVDLRSPPLHKTKCVAFDFETWWRPTCTTRGNMGWGKGALLSLAHVRRENCADTA
jgi:hypothetical protein